MDTGCRAGLQLADSSPTGSGGVFDHQLDHTSNMAVTYAPDAPEVETPERELMFTASSDALDAVVGELEAYSQAPSMTATEYAFDEPVEESLEVLPDKRGLVLAAVFSYSRLFW